MDIHRCRFVPYQPQSINALAFSHVSQPKSPSPQDLRLALGRENGDVEIWNPLRGHWIQEKILRGSRDRTVEQLAWTQDIVAPSDSADANSPFEREKLRLFTSGGSSAITEWDLAAGQPKRNAQSNTNEIWCFAAQPQWERGEKALDMKAIARSPSQLLAAGCADGSVVLFTTAEDDLQYSQTLAKPSTRGAKVISITWRGRDMVLAGYEDGEIRVIDVPKKATIRTMSLGKTANDPYTVVWTLKCLPDGTILSGDSSGELKIWDPLNYSLVQRLKSHEADVLEIAVSSTGDTIFTTGVDRRVVVHKQLPVQALKRKERWQKITHRRFHQHDVKALVSFESKDLSVIASGGMDTVPMVLPLSNWDTENHRTLSHLPQKPQLSCSSEARLMLTWWDHDILIWQLPKGSVIDSSSLISLDANRHRLLARLRLKGDENISSAQISRDGRMVVAATSAGTRLFQLRKRAKLDEVEIRTRPVNLPASLSAFGAYMVGFSPDNKWLYAIRSNNLIVMVKILPGESLTDRPQICDQVIKLGRHSKSGFGPSANKLEEYIHAIHCATFSNDGRILAVGSLSGSVDWWVLKGHEDLQDRLVDTGKVPSDSESDSDSETDSDDDDSDSRIIHGQKWVRGTTYATLPNLSSAIVALSFRPQSHSAGNTSGDSLGLHATRHNPHPISHELPLTDTKLVAVTTSHEVMEFDIFSGKLSDWSRRNPSSLLPQSFTQIKDRAMGIFWDSNPPEKERLWLYGPTWLFMLDMTRDLNVVDAQDKVGQIGRYDVREPPDTSPMKRVNDDSSSVHSKKRRKRNTGAGDERIYKRSSNARYTSIRSGGNTGLMSPVSDGEGSQVDSDEDNQTQDGGTLIHLRRGPEPADVGNGDEDLDDTSKQVQPLQHVETLSTPSHHTIFRYRSIFGIAALDPGPEPESEPRAEQDHSANLEIVLVERPMYDIDLLPRFDGGQDWTT